jgi:pyroglutamyl-peptidase
MRVVITGFGPFPGALYNPTPELVARLLKLRRPALADVTLSAHVFPVTYRAVDAQLPALLDERRPDALLMFGLAARTPYVRIEMRARNDVTTLWPDGAGAHGARRAKIAPGGASALAFGAHGERLVRAAQLTGIDARASRDAGRYLCNYLCWRAIEAAAQAPAPLAAAFVHVPLIRRTRSFRRLGSGAPIAMDELTDAAEAMLMALIAQARRNRLADRGDARTNAAPTRILSTSPIVQNAV